MSEFDFIGLVETWLSEDISNSEYFLDTYVIYRCDRRFNEVGLSRGGGALVAIKNNLSSTEIDLSLIMNTLPAIDIVGCKCFVKNHFILNIFVIYIPPNFSVANFELFLDLFEQILDTTKKLLILGDFNLTLFNVENTHDIKSQLMRNFIQFTGVTQYNDVVNVNDRLLDLVFSNMLCQILHDTAPLLAEDMHHPALHIQFEATLSTLIDFPSNENSKNYNFRKADYPALYNSLSDIDWSFINDAVDVDSACNLFYEKLYSIFDVHVPLYKTNKKKYPIWYTSEIIYNIGLKNKYRDKYNKTKLNQYLLDFKRVRALTKLQVKQAFRTYILQVQHNVVLDPKQFWSYINNKKRSTRIPGKMYFNNDSYDSPEAIVNAFSNYFSSVYPTPTDSNSNSITEAPNYSYCSCLHIKSISENEIRDSFKKLKNKNTAGYDQVPSFLVRDCSNIFIKPMFFIYNLAIRTSTFPECWKLGKVCPVLKAGNSSDIANYRPIVILSNFAKAFEISMYNCIYPSVKNLISPCQHGFMEKRSTVSNLVSITQYISYELDSQGQVDVIYTDFSKAFDLIDHSILLTKLTTFGFSNTLVKFFKSYLGNRLQYVSYNSHRSDPYIATSGVPQGSNLGPMLFLLFIEDLTLSVSSEKLLYADDLKIFRIIHTTDDCALLQDDINRVEEWCIINKFKMNISKCKAVTYTRKINPIHHTYTYSSVQLSRTDLIEDLGVLFDAKLTFTMHMYKITESSLKLLGFMTRNCKSFTNVVALKCLYFSLIRSKLDYCAAVWHPYYNVHSLLLEGIQRKFLKFLAFKLDGQYPYRGISEETLLARFDLPSLKFRRILNTVVFLYKLLHNNIDSSFILQYINFRVPSSNTRLNTTFSCPVARTNLILKSPVYVMCNTFNHISNECDINFCSLKILTSTLRNFLTNNLMN